MAGRTRKYSWANGFSAENISPPDYQSKLVSNETEISAAAEKYMQIYNRAVGDFRRKTSLTALDMGILVLAAALQTSRWIIIDAIKFAAEKTSAVYKKFPSAKTSTEFLPATVEKIAEDFSKKIAPYDALKKPLAQKPVVGLIVGTANIATNTATADDFSNNLPSYYVANQKIAGAVDFPSVMKWTGGLLLEEPKIIGAAFTRQVFQCGEDFFRKLNLPPPPVENISSEMSEFLTGKEIGEASFAAVINKLVEMCHRIFFDPKRDDAKFYEVRTRKILTYSNTLSSILNVSCVGISGNVLKLDTGGIFVTLWRILNDSEKIRQIQLEFINKTLDGELRREEDAINQQLAKWGFSI